MECSVLYKALQGGRAYHGIEGHVVQGREVPETLSMPLGGREAKGAGTIFSLCSILDTRWACPFSYTLPYERGACKWVRRNIGGLVTTLETYTG